MKKILFTIALIGLLSAVAFAKGPLLGIGFVPNVNDLGELTVGYDFGPINIEASTLSFETYIGTWAIGALWTPQVGNFGYRAGACVLLNWATGATRYEGFNFIVGASNTWGPFQLYGDLRLNPTGRLVVLPVIGINFLFGDLIPDVAAD